MKYVVSRRMRENITEEIMAGGFDVFGSSGSPPTPSTTSSS
jgi:hypothetical protein